MCDYDNAKMASPGIMGLRSDIPAEQGYAVGCQETKAYRPPTLADEQEKSASHHFEQASKAQQAAAFLRLNPAFDEFIRLIRKGVIQIALLVIVASAFGQEKAKSPGEAPKPPVISDAHQAEFQKARADYDEAQMQVKAVQDAVKAAQDEMNAKIKVLQDDCGPLWQAQLDKERHPFCAAKPPEAAKK
jgi:hypothetical protein